jgi:hypothetical protein
VVIETKKVYLLYTYILMLLFLCFLFIQVLDQPQLVSTGVQARLVHEPPFLSIERLQFNEEMLHYYTELELEVYDV